jgi:hypothetical protein
MYNPQAMLLLNKRFTGAKPDAISMYHNLHEWRVDPVKEKEGKDGP